MGGASNRAWNIARAMQLAKHDVKVVAAYPYYPHGRVSPEYRRRLFTKEKYEGFDVIRVWIPSLPTQGLFNRLLIYIAFTFSYSVAQLLLIRRRLDLIYYVSPYALSVFSLPAIAFGEIVGAKVFLDVADLWPEVILEIGRVKTPFAARIVNLMAKVTSLLSHLTTPITESIRERLLELGLPEGKLEIVELAIDTDYFKPQPRKSLDARFDGKYLVEYSGVIGPKYDFHSLIEAAKIIERKHPDLRILIRGDGEWLPYVKRLATGTRNVIVLDKIESTAGVLDYLNAADILVCPMRDLKETSTIVPSKVLEYFAVGKPVICSGRGETEQLMNEYEPGIMVGPDDPKAFADAVLRLYEDRTLYEHAAKESRELALERYGLPILSRRIEELVQRSMS